MGRIPHDCTLGADSESALQTFLAKTLRVKESDNKGIIVANNANLPQSSVASVFVILA